MENKCNENGNSLNSFQQQQKKNKKPVSCEQCFKVLRIQKQQIFINTGKQTLATLWILFCLAWCSNPDFTSNKPKHYLLDYSDFNKLCRNNV